MKNDLEQTTLSDPQKGFYANCIKGALNLYHQKTAPLTKMEAKQIETGVRGILIHNDGHVETIYTDESKAAIKKINELKDFYFKTLVTDELKALGINEGDLK